MTCFAVMGSSEATGSSARMIFGFWFSVRINKEYKISILLNIHHVDLALKYCDRVIGIRAGEIVFDGPASTITQEQIDEVYNGAKAPTMGEGEGELKTAKAEG